MRRLKDERMRERKIRQKTDRTKRSWTDRSLSLLCVAAMLAGVVLGPLETTDVMASESALTCTQAEHTHGDGCYQNQLTCGKNEHTHGDGCFNENGEVVCGQEEHGHTGDCYTKVLACTQAEHTHSGSCYTIVEPETTPQTTAETTPQTTAETTAQTTAETTPQTTAETTAQTTAETTAQTAAETTPQTQESIIVESTETVQGTEAASESETTATELKVSATTDMKYAVAGKDALTFTTKVSGGTAPLTVKYEIKLDGKTVYEQNEYAETVSWMPTSYGEHTLYMTVTDAAGKTTRVDCTIPVSVNETENGDIWRQSVQSVTLTGEYGKDIAAIAKTQIGTKENKKNFIINKEGKKEYYSRYGQWYGDTYEEWSAMFVSFCAEYAGIPASYLPREKEISKWIQKLGNLYESKDGHTPEIGDLVFFSENTHRDGNSQIQNGNPSHVGIVIDTDGTNIWTVEGNCGGAVAKQQYSISDGKITGYVGMDRVMELAGKITVSETEAEEDTETESESESESEGLTEESTESGSETEETAPLVPEKVIITTDDVNLRAEPTTDAEVIAVVDNGTELELLGAVEAADGIWYRVNYVEAETAVTEEIGETLTETEQTELPSETAVAEQEAAPAGVEAFVRSDLADVVVPEIKEPKVMTYEDGEVIVTVTEVTAGAIPENVSLKVTPLRKDDASTAGQYAEVEAKLQEKAENEEYETLGFLAYDISLIDAEGNEIEPNGEVKVSLNYVKATIPSNADFGDLLTDEGSDDADGIPVEGTRYTGVSVLHFEEDESGQVKDIVDIGKNDQIIDVDVNGSKEIQSAQFVTNSFSLYVFDWQGEAVTTYDLTSTGSSVPEERTLTHEKYIKDNKDGTYDLTLTVSGAVGSTTNKAKLDIVLVVDTSGSMQGSNMTKTKEAVNNLVATMNEKSETIDAKWKLVTFANSATIRTADWTTGNSVNTTVQGLNGNGGTNYQDALVKAQTAVSSGAREDASSIVIFLTDGEPTFYLRSGNTVSNAGTATRGGGNYTSRNDYNGAIMGASDLTCTRFYAVGIGLEDDVYNGMSGLQVLQNVANAVNASTKEAKNVEANDLSDIFDDIASDITTLLCSNVTITDTLSEYVEIVEGSPLVISVYDENGKKVNYGANSLEIESGITATATYDSTKRQIVLAFPESYRLKAGYTYTVTAQIVTNATAENKYRDDKAYPNTGDEGTDAEGNYTSSGQPGFYSNESAEVSYTYNGEGKKEEYPKPVVQLSEAIIKEIIGETPDPTPRDLNHEKYIKSNGDEDNTYDLTLTISGKVGSETNKALLDIMLIVDRSNSMNEGSRLSKAKEAVKALVNAIDPKEIDAKWNLVTFASLADDATGWKTGAEINQRVQDLSVANGNYGGTNYQAGFVKASAELADARPDATKIVIFLTDGVPTLHLCRQHKKNSFWDYYYHPSLDFQCNHIDYVDNTGSACLGGSIKTNDADFYGARLGANTITCDQFYAIGVGLDSNVSYEYKNDLGQSITLNGGGAILGKIIESVNASIRPAPENIKTDDLVNTFKNIAATITQFLCSNVTIEDELSEYVEWIEGTDLVITVKDKDGVVKVTGKNEVTVDDATLKASYNSDTRSIILDFPDAYELQAGYVYSVTAKVTPTDKAYDEYTKTGYPHIGDEGTDAPDNTTSSNQPGFYSNNKATVKYTYKGEKDSSDYADPVVQVYQNKLKVQKTDEYGEPLAGAYFGLYSVTQNENGEKVTKLVKSIASDDSGSIDFGSLTSGNYILKETNAPTGYKKLSEELSFTVSKGKINFTNIEELKDSLNIYITESKDNDNTYVYTVTAKNEPELIDFTVEKQWYDQDGKQTEGTDEVTVTLYAKDLDGEPIPEDVYKIKQPDATLTAGNSYTHTWEGLRKYYKDNTVTTGNPWKEIEYTVKEKDESGGAITINSNQYHVEYEPKTTDDKKITGYTIKNTKWTEWSIVKNEIDTTNPLAGAEFLLKNLSDDDPTDANAGIDYYGLSDDSGVIRWYSDSTFQKIVAYIPKGTYQLSETKAPEGYSKSGVIWNISVSEYGVPTITRTGSSGEETVDPSSGSDGTTILYRFYNYKLYSLPSTGGRGIYWYLIGGMLLMMAASLILYKNKCKEVLKS